MTKNAIQTPSSPTASLSLSLSLTPDEWHFVFSLLCELHTTLVRGVGVLGLCDLADRRDTVSSLLRKVADRNEQGEVCLSEFEIYELHTALGGFAHYPYDIDTLEREQSLLASVRDKLSAAESAVESSSVPVAAGQQVLPFFSEPEPAPSVEPSVEAEAVGMPPLVSWDDFKRLDFRKLGARLDENTFRTERLGAIVDILKGVPALGAAKEEYAGIAGVDDVLEAARMLRRDYNLLRDSYDALCDDYEQALSLIDRLKDRLKEVLSSSSSASTSGVKKGSKARRAATARTGRWYESLSLEVSA